MSSSLSFNFLLLLLIIIFLYHHHIMKLFHLWTYTHSNKIYFHHCPCDLLTASRITQNLQAMAKDTKIAFILIYNPLHHSNCLCMLSYFRNGPMDAITSAFFVGMLLPRLFVAFGLKNYSPRKKLILNFYFSLFVINEIFYLIVDLEVCLTIR